MFKTAFLQKNVDNFETLISQRFSYLQEDKEQFLKVRSFVIKDE